MIKLHECRMKSPYDAYGEALTHCNENDKEELWAGNGEYGSQVNFCPKCGYQAKKKYVPTDSRGE